MNVLVVLGHPNDEVLGAGGTIAKLTAAGNIVHCWFYFRGENCNGETQTQPEEVATILGSQYPPLSFKLGIDNESDTVPMIDIARRAKLYNGV